MMQNLGPAPSHEPILKTVGNKHVIAFFGPATVRLIWNDDFDAKSAGVRISLNLVRPLLSTAPRPSPSSFVADHAETLAAINGDQ